VPLLITTTILWAFSFSLIGEFLAGQVDSWFSVLVRLSLAALAFLPFLRWRGYQARVLLLYMAVGACQLGIMYMISSGLSVFIGAGIFAVHRYDTVVRHAGLRFAAPPSAALGVYIERAAGGGWRGDHPLQRR